LFLPLLLAGALTYVVAVSLRQFFGVLSLQWFLVLFMLCFLFSIFVVGFTGYFVERYDRRNKKTRNEQ
jgi:4-hydroxybenzoate polyprenyltransferase